MADGKLHRGRLHIPLRNSNFASPYFLTTLAGVATSPGLSMVGVGYGRTCARRQYEGQLRGTRMPVSTQRAGCALYEIDPATGATIEIFYADRAVAQSFVATR
jgi:hypothetical protein